MRILPSVRTIVGRCLPVIVAGALVLTSVAVTPHPVLAAPLVIVDVGAPAINCIYDTDCTITVDDLADPFVPPAASGDGFLQSRTFPVGEAGAPAAGLYGYLYRIDLRAAVAVTAVSCVTEMRIDFGPIVPLDYNLDGVGEHVFVVTSGGLGNVRPVMADQTGAAITFLFDPAVCPGASAGAGDSSFFFGLTSTQPPHDVTAHLAGSLGLATDLKARAPQLLSHPDFSEPQTPTFSPNGQPRTAIRRSDNQGFAADVAFGEPQLAEVAAPDGKTYVQFASPGLDRGDGLPGHPDVPVYHRLLAVPHGAAARLGAVNTAGGQTVPGVLYPIQPEALDQEGKPGEFGAPPFVRDDAAYQQSAPTPAQPVSLHHVGRLRDLDLVQLSIAAGRFLPAQGELELFKAVSFEIEFTGGEGFFLDERSQNPFEDAPKALYDLTINHDAIYNYIGSVVFPWSCLGYEYLIITDPAFRPAADDLATWKVAKGISTSVVETGNDPGDAGTTNAQIRDYIRSYYDDCLVRPSYVLLLGDSEFIPPFYRDSMGTDLDYALMNDDDWLPDLAYGRIPVDTLEQAQTVVDKIVAYEKIPPFVPAFYGNMSLASYFECCRDDVAQDGRDARSFVETAELVRAAMEDEGYTVERIYTTDTDYEPDYGPERDATPRRYYNGALLPLDIRAGSGFAWDGDTGDTVNAFNDGRFLIFHRDHGGVNGWSSPSFATGDIGGLTNGSLLPVVYSVNCASGLFDNESSPGVYGTAVGNAYWAEQLLRKSDGGAVAVIGDTRNSPTWANSALARGLFDATWPDVLPADGGATSIRRVGDILNYAKTYLAGQVGVGQTAGWVSSEAADTDIILYHVYGDPTLEMWTGNPHKFELPIYYEPVTLHRDWWTIHYAVEGATITALQGGKPVARGVVVNGQADLKFITDVDAGQGLQLSASLPDGVSTLLETADARGHVNPQGGRVEDGKGVFAIDFPAGAVQQDVQILYHRLASPTHTLDNGMTGLFHFVLDGLLDGGSEQHQFGADYAIHLNIGADGVGAAAQDAEETLQCVYYAEGQRKWLPLETQVDTAQQETVCRADHFTEFALVRMAGAPMTQGQQLLLPLVNNR